MIYREALASPPLAEFIKCYWALEYPGSAGPQEPEPVLPDGCPEIVFNLSDRFARLCAHGEERQPTAILAGQMTAGISIRPSGNVRLFGIRFKPAGAFSLLTMPMYEITDRIVDLASVDGLAAFGLEEKMNEAASFVERVAVFESFFKKNLADRGPADPVAGAASSFIVGLCGQASIPAIAEKVGVSERQFERRFKRTVGVSPKMFSRIVRFQTVVRAARDRSFSGLLDAALAAGYYDQSHLIRDFKEFSGVTPLVHFQRLHRISDVFTGAAR
jgi:AraC-like DNA-binding protein